MTVAGFVLAFLALVAWGLSSPVGSSPDDDFHLASIWCGLGERPGLCQAAADPGQRVIPQDLVTAPCFAYDPTKSAACQGPNFGLHPDQTRATGRGNFVNALYPPVFYLVMGLFAGQNVVLSVLGMRIFASMFFVTLVAALYTLLPVNRRSQLIWPLAITLVPLGMFLIPSTNPSGWAILSAGTLWIALVGYFEQTGWRKLGLGAFALLSTIVGAGARADSAAFAVVAVGASLILSFKPTRRFFVAAILPVVLIAVSVALFFSGSQSAAASGGLNGTGPVSFEALKSLVLINTLNVPQLWAGVFGYWGLGWLDTGMPAAVWFIGIGVFFAAVLAGIRSMSARKAVTFGLMLLTIWAFPMLLLIQTQAYVGEYIQPRYALPLIVLFAGIALFQANSLGLSPTKLQIALLIGALSLANAASLYANIRRYVTGTDVTGFNLNSGVEWWWSGGLSPMAVWLLGMTAFTAMLIAIGYPLWLRARSIPVVRALGPDINLSDRARGN